jgi:hypothetical protein
MRAQAATAETLFLKIAGCIIRIEPRIVLFSLNTKVPVQRGHEKIVQEVVSAFIKIVAEDETARSLDGGCYVSRWRVAAERAVRVLTAFSVQLRGALHDRRDEKSTDRCR